MELGDVSAAGGAPDAAAPDANDSSSGDDGTASTPLPAVPPKATLGRRMGLRLQTDQLRDRFLRSIRKNDAAGVRKTLLVSAHA